jgi:membrane-bound inhibitor of C-type lysozyme
MKNNILTIIIIAFLTFTACEKNILNVVSASPMPEIEDIVHFSIANENGTMLDMAFNNTKETATFVFNGETIETKQDTTASGIKYSNLTYEYTEHQGEIYLKKNGKTVFDSK